MKIIQLDRKPRKGDRLGFGEFIGYDMTVKPPTKARFTVVKCDGNLCWQLEDGKTESQPFIFWFQREQMFNKLAHRFVEADELEVSSDGESQAQGCVSAPT